MLSWVPGATLLIKTDEGSQNAWRKALDSWPVVSPEAPDPEAADPAAPPLAITHPCLFPRFLGLGSHLLASEIPPTLQDPEQSHLHCPVRSSTWASHL